MQLGGKQILTCMLDSRGMVSRQGNVYYLKDYGEPGELNAAGPDGI